MRGRETGLRRRKRTKEGGGRRRGEAEREWRQRREKVTERETVGNVSGGKQTGTSLTDVSMRLGEAKIGGNFPKTPP